jgi:hypothetical protein
MIHPAPAVPHDLKTSEIISVKIVKVQKYISIVWKRDGLMFGLKDDYNKLIATISRLKQQILQRPNINHRFEFWECVNEHGVYDWDVEQKLKTIRGIGDI